MDAAGKAAETARLETRGQLYNTSSQYYDSRSQH